MKKFLLVMCVGLLVACSSASTPTDNSGDPAATAAPDAPAAPAAPVAPAAQARPPHMANSKGEAFEGDVPFELTLCNF